jgi:hypothetical protein
MAARPHADPNGQVWQFGYEGGLLSAVASPAACWPPRSQLLGRHRGQSNAWLPHE